MRMENKKAQVPPGFSNTSLNDHYHSLRQLNRLNRCLQFTDAFIFQRITECYVNVASTNAFQYRLNVFLSVGLGLFKNLIPNGNVADGVDAFDDRMLKEPAYFRIEVVADVQLK